MLIAGTGRRSVHNRTLVSGGLRSRLTRLLKFSGNTLADYQPGNYTGTLNASAWLNSIGAAPSLAQASGAAQPIILPFAGAKYVYLPAVASNTVTTPTKTITGNFTKTYDIALNDYTPAADVTIDAKTSGNDGFTVKWLTTDKLRLVIGDGAALTNFDATVASGLTDGTRHTITITYVDNATMDLKIDGVAWGTQVTVNKVLTNAAVSWTLGSTTSIGKVYDHTMTNGGATTYYHLNPAASAETSTNAATWVSDNGETYTLNNTGALPAQIVGSPSLLFDGAASTMASTFTLNQPSTTYSVFSVLTYGNGGNQVLFSGEASEAGMYNGTVGSTLTQFAGSNAGFATGPTVRTFAVITSVLNGASSQWQIGSATATSGNAGANNPGGATVGSGNTPNSWAHVQFKEHIVRSGADSAATQAQIQALLKQIHGTP